MASARAPCADEVPRAHALPREPLHLAVAPPALPGARAAHGRHAAEDTPTAEAPSLSSSALREEGTPKGELLLYQAEDGRARIECGLKDESVWLTQALMAQLFDIGVGIVNHHLKEIFAEGELAPEATIRRH
ncbi:hypothetical protein [Myxococcus sp. AM010]|uniref:hypothetical protein n=1 Tax=Myxococcus sp. AM010 TaxID=2745138 RepID=UPI001C3DE094|nr:hypothetical protein [Myxococcus sp. AM010]